ncbi:MAG: SUMF1/EgtB/PvdO family nonheme iron enzyme, partial [bacterium]|nr:SUMF1/EgtB/PvdO family nonheme iron enzyme [bacterium]
MVKIFISYRRADSKKDAGRIYDRLVESFGKQNVFKDVDDIELGADFRGVLREAVAKCDILLAVIGKHWLTVTDDKTGKRRLDNPDDFVRIEIESALQRDKCLVIPLLVDGAFMPSADELPMNLRELAFKNATLVRDDPDFHKDVDKLIASIQRQYGTTPPPKNTPTTDVYDLIGKFYSANEAQNWDDARALLAEIRATGKIPRTFNADAFERDIWDFIQVQDRDREYAVLQKMVGKVTQTIRIWEGLLAFWEAYPTHDPDNLARFKPAPPKPVRSKLFDILPQPFDLITIPKGNVTLITEDTWADNYVPKGKAGTTFTVPEFQIAKYPATNAQFRLFIEAGGYKTDKWWTQAGIAQRNSDKWTQPRYWDDDKWNGADQPVVGVSWYEAVAFCLWLSETTGEKIMLPTEQGWQRAAQGDKGLIYPWGNDWNGNLCNNNVDGKGIGKTTPVRHYEGKGDSPFGVVDMAGNVWEWCSTAYKTGVEDLEGTDVRV